MLPLYLVTLVISAGLTGLFARHVLAELGFVPDFDSGVLLAGSVALLYGTLQLGYMALLRLLQPTRSPGPYITEMLSHAAVAAFVPLLMDLQVNWPHSAIDKVEPLVYLAAFGLIHTFFKLATLYASLQGELGSRTYAIAWTLAAVVVAGLSLAAAMNWVATTQAARVVAEGEAVPYRVGDVFALARPLTEGSVLVHEMPPTAGHPMTLRWANAPALSEDAATVEVAYATIKFQGGDETDDYTATIGLSRGGWSEIRIPAASIPLNTTRCEIRWARVPVPSWQKLVGLDPIVYRAPEDEESRVAIPPQVLVSGPFMHLPQEGDGLNFLLVLVDNLAPEQLPFLEGDAGLAPALARFAATSMVFGNAYTPSPSTQAAAATLLSGIHPLNHGFFGGEGAVLPATMTSLAEILSDRSYLTAAFTEGESVAGPDLIYGSGIERGFETFDGSYDDAESLADGAEALFSPSALTLEHLRNWLDRNRDVKFFAFARLRSLEGLEPRSDTYAAALAELDRHLGALIKYIRDYETRTNTVLVVTSPGVFSAEPALSEPQLRVPLIFSAPGFGSARRADFVSLEDMAPSMAAAASFAWPGAADGKPFLIAPNGRQPVAVQHRPPLLSIRSDAWRLTWRPGGELGEVVGLYQASRRSDWWRQDVQQREPAQAGRLRDELRALWVSAQSGGGLPQP